MYSPTASKIHLREEERPEYLQSLGIVFASLVAGVGYNATAKMFGIAGIPFMPFNTFKRIEAKLTPEIWKYWEKSREKAHALEKAAAIERGDMDANGNWYIGITMDGGCRVHPNHR